LLPEDFTGAFAIHGNLDIVSSVKNFHGVIGKGGAGAIIRFTVNGKFIFNLRRISWCRKTADGSGDGIPDIVAHTVKAPERVYHNTREYQ
jgi:hypothetical protein